jgi:hypothetical protein
MFPEYDVEGFKAITETPFGRFWDAYPPGRKVSKDKCSKRFASIPKKHILALMAALREDMAGWDAQYTPMPYTWLNRRRWLDAPLEEMPRFHANGEEKIVHGPLSAEAEAAIDEYVRQHPGGRR